MNAENSIIRTALNAVLNTDAKAHHEIAKHLQSGLAVGNLILSAAKLCGIEPMPFSDWSNCLKKAHEIYAKRHEVAFKINVVTEKAPEYLAAYYAELLSKYSFQFTIDYPKESNGVSYVTFVVGKSKKRLHFEIQNGQFYVVTGVRYMLHPGKNDTIIFVILARDY